MSHVVPLIRAAGMVPFLRWMYEADRPVERLLEDADLAMLPFLDPVRPIPVWSAAAFLRGLSRQEGPDIGCRVVSSASILELATLGRIALGARTPREALARSIAALHFHCTHEHITLGRGKGGTVVRQVITLPFDAETRHVVQQYVASMIRALCAMTGAPDPLFRQAAIVPHPESGLAHLEPWLGAPVVASTTGGLVLRIPDSVMDRPFPLTAGVRRRGPIPAGWGPLRGDGSYTGSARRALESMLGEPTPTVERLAAAAGVSIRTLQRRLGAENVTFSALLEDVRRAEALRELGRHGATIGEIAARLGYTQQTSLTRAVRRWTGVPPRQHRAREMN